MSADPREPPAADAGAASPSRPPAGEFRALMHKGIRYPMKLEPVFWNVLEIAAKSRQQRLSQYVGALLERDPTDGNRASLARVHVVDWLRQQLAAASRSALGPRSLHGIASAMTAPCFIVDAGNRITASNEAFTRFARRELHLDGTSTSVRLTISFRRDIEALRAAIAASREKFVEDLLVLKAEQGAIERIGRIVGLETPAGGHFGLLVTFQSESSIRVAT